MWKQILKNISYSAIVLDAESRDKLLSLDIPKGWKPIAHHMTINLGPLKENSQYNVGDVVSMNITAIGQNNKAMAVKVDANREMKGFSHITIAINPEGGKPVHSNFIEDFESFSGKLKGTVKEIPFS